MSFPRRVPVAGVETLGIRWTVGDVSPLGFEALRLSIWGAWRLFGPEAAYGVVVNTIPVDRARALTGEVPEAVAWRVVSGTVPPVLAAHLDDGMAEGVGWKFDPLRVFPDRFELALDNDLILWGLPHAVRHWLDRGAQRVCVLSEDVRPCFGRFSSLCGRQPRNTGLRGLPPGFDLGMALRAVLSIHPHRLDSECDEQGLQVAALSLGAEPVMVTLNEVTVCSPFYPHLSYLGRCGAHFVGLNRKDLPWRYYDRPAKECMVDHWHRHRLAVYAAVGLTPEPIGVRLAATGR